MGRMFVGNMKRWVVLLIFALIVGSAGAGCAHAAKRDKKKKEKDPFEASTGGVFLYSVDAEKRMGQDVKAEVLKEYKLYENAELVDYVRKVGARIASYADRQNVTYEFFVLDDPLINAFALPGGTIYITRGILTVFNNEAELAAVLGHEITHVVERHSMKHMQGQQILGIGLKILAKGQDIPLWQQIASDLLVFKPYGRGDELRSDAIGMKYAYQSGYQADRAINVFQEFQKRDEAHVPAFLRSHPVDATRIAQIQNLWSLIQTREDIKPSATPLATNDSEYARIVFPHTYRVFYPQVKAAFDEMAAAIGRKDIEGLMKGVAKKFKSSVTKGDRDALKKYYEDVFNSAEKISASAEVREYRFLGKDVIAVLGTMTEDRTYKDGRSEKVSETAAYYFVKRPEKETAGADWMLARIESGEKW